MDIHSERFVDDIDIVNVSDIVPGGVVRDSMHDDMLGFLYPFTPKSKTKSITVKFVVKTGEFKTGNVDGSFMVVDLGGNCGYCRSYIPAGNKQTGGIMFGWEIKGCPEDGHNNPYPIESNSWYAFEQGRWRVASGENKGKDYVYMKIDGRLIRSFYAEPDSRPFRDNLIYIEATHKIQVIGYSELGVKYYVDGKLFLDQFAQKGLNVKEPTAPEKTGCYFMGWCTEKSGGELFDFYNTKLSDNINLYARFTTETVKAVFNPRNGSGILSVTAGKNCLIPKPETPTFKDGKYEYVFVGWKNKTTGKLFDFKTDRISEDTEFSAEYREKEYYVSYYSLGKLVEKVPFLRSNPTVAGKEPEVPEIPNTTSCWEKHKNADLTNGMTVNAVYTVTVPKISGEIKLKEYGGKTVTLNNDVINDYLSADISVQTAFVRDYCSKPHKYQDYQNIGFSWEDSGENSGYTVYFADNKDFENAYIFITDKTEIKNEVGIFMPGKTYYWFVCGNSTGKCSKVDSFNIEANQVRYITAGKVGNMRDIGGYKTADGKQIKYGLVYRTAALDELTSYVDDAARGVFNYLGMKSEIELRGGFRHSFAGWDENNPNVYYVDAQGYQDILYLDEEKKALYKNALEKMADKNNYPFCFHCSGGADRTGNFAYLIEGLLGASYDDIRADYELTSFSKSGLRTADIFMDCNSFDEMNRLIIEQYGGGSNNLQTAVENFLIDYFKLEKSAVESIKTILKE